MEENSGCIPVPSPEGVWLKDLKVGMLLLDLDCRMVFHVDVVTGSGCRLSLVASERLRYHEGNWLAGYKILDENPF